MNKKQVAALLAKQTLCVLATASPKGKPQAALIEFSQNDKQILFFDTFRSSTKYRNLQKNPRVAAVVNCGKDKTLQITGRAKELSGKALADAYRAHRRKLKGAAQFENRKDVAYFSMTPAMIVYTDVSKKPWTVETLHYKSLI